MRCLIFFAALLSGAALALDPVGSDLEPAKRFASNALTSIGSAASPSTSPRVCPIAVPLCKDNEDLCGDCRDKCCTKATATKSGSSASSTETCGPICIQSLPNCKENEEPCGCCNQQCCPKKSVVPSYSAPSPTASACPKTCDGKIVDCLRGYKNCGCCDDQCCPETTLSTRTSPSKTAWSAPQSTATCGPVCPALFINCPTDQHRCGCCLLQCCPGATSTPAPTPTTTSTSKPTTMTTTTTTTCPKVCPLALRECPSGQTNCGCCLQSCCATSTEQSTVTGKPVSTSSTTTTATTTCPSICPFAIRQCPSGQKNCGCCLQSCCAMTSAAASPIASVGRVIK